MPPGCLNIGIPFKLQVRRVFTTQIGEVIVTFGWATKAISTGLTLVGLRNGKSLEVLPGQCARCPGIDPELHLLLIILADPSEDEFTKPTSLTRLYLGDQCVV